ncbi:MAG TPA: hypothetical protein VGN15_11155 [Ktedonobacteraceae bacterium]|nr:hypothetical protein [Ktedonobacteraceae bacterium]
MPKKARNRKRVATQKNAQTMQQVSTTPEAVEATTRKTVSNRPFTSPRVSGPQSLIWPCMVALGCWGMAFSFYAFSTDPNHVLFAGMASLLALLWSFSVVMRVRKLRVLRRKS